jgi:hypothetical protein
MDLGGMALHPGLYSQKAFFFHVFSFPNMGGGAVSGQALAVKRHGQRRL